MYTCNYKCRRLIEPVDFSRADYAPGSSDTDEPWPNRTKRPVRSMKQSRGSPDMPPVPLSAVASTAISVMHTLLPQILWYFPSPGSMGGRRGKDEELYSVSGNT